MILIGNVMQGVAGVLSTLCSLYTWVFIIGALVSWVQPNPHNQIVRFIRAITEPALYRIRKFIPFSYTSGVDFSPLIAILLIQLFNSVIISTIYEYGLQLK